MTNTKWNERSAARPNFAAERPSEQGTERGLRAPRQTNAKAHTLKVPRATQQRSLETRQKIIDAAIVQFARNGYQGASTRAIAIDAGLQHTLVTYHFKSKERLWRAAISSLLAEYRSAFESRLSGLRGVEDVIKLQLIDEDFIRFSAENLHFHQMMSNVASVPSGQLDWLVHEYLSDIFESRAALVRSAQAKGRYVAGDPLHLHYLFIGAVTRIFMLSAEVDQIMGRSPLDPKFVDEHIAVVKSLFFRDPPAPGAGRAKPSLTPPDPAPG